MHRLEGITLHVAFDESDIADTFGLGVGPAELQKCVATVDAQHRAFGADTPGDLYRRIAEAAAYVHGFVAGADLQLREYQLTVMVQAAHENVTVLGKFWNQDVVPEVDELSAAGCCRGGAHDRYSVVVGLDDDTLHRHRVRTISPRAANVSIVSTAGITIPGNKGTHVKAHLRRDVPVAYAHRAGASSEATAVQAVGTVAPVHMLDTDGDIVAAG